MDKRSVEIPQKYYDLIEEQIADHDEIGTVEEIMSRATAEKLQELAKEEHREEHIISEGKISEEERDLHRQLVDLGVVEGDPILLGEM